MKLIPLLVSAVALGLPAGAQAAPEIDTAPGRVVIRVDDGAVQRNVDAGGAVQAVALPDGSALLFGSGAGSQDVLYAAKIARNGALDPAFGSGGVKTIDAPGGASFALRQVLRQPDGKLLMISAHFSTQPQFAPNALEVTRVNADLSIDRAYGIDGTRTTPIGEGCAACTTAALAPDGSLVLTGIVGQAGPPITPNTPPDFHWALTRLTPSGAVDTGFGSGGVATVAATGSTSGFNVAFGPGGSIVTEGQVSNGMTSQILLTRLTSSGAPDPAFAGGTPILVPLASGFGMLVQGDGSVVLNGGPLGAPSSLIDPSFEKLVRYTAAGAPDAGFGAGGSIDLGSGTFPSQLLPAAGGSVVVASGATGARTFRLVTATGTIPVRRTVNLRFGGGGSSFLVSVRPRPVGSLLQNSFASQQILRRPDGSYLVPGGVQVRQPTGEGAGFSIGRFAAASLTPSLGHETAFGGPRTPLRLSVSLRRQRAVTARRRHGIRISLRASEAGLARVRITAGGRLVAHSLLPVFGTTRRTLPVELTRYGNAYLRRHRGIRVSIAATGRDLLANTARATARGRLR